MNIGKVLRTAFFYKPPLVAASVIRYILTLRTDYFSVYLRQFGDSSKGVRRVYLKTYDKDITPSETF